MLIGPAWPGLTVAAALILVGMGTDSLDAQQTLKRTVLQKADLVGLSNREGLVVLVEIPPGAETGRHTHPGAELGYLIEGSLLLEVEGKPAVTAKAGETWIIDEGQAHNAKSVGDVPAQAVVTYVAEKGKPLAAPAP